jgi:hypothetical protein
MTVMPCEWTRTHQRLVHRAVHQRCTAAAVPASPTGGGGVEQLDLEQDPCGGTPSIVGSTGDDAHGQDRFGRPTRHEPTDRRRAMWCGKASWSREETSTLG